MDDIDQIIAKMSASQQGKLFAIGNGRPREYALGQSGSALVRKGLAFVNELGARHLTDLGWAVRKQLEEIPHDVG